MGPTRERTPHEHFHPFDFPRCRTAATDRLPAAIAAIEAGIKANDDRAFEESLGAMSPFEVKNLLVKMAKQGDEGTTRTLLNAGRGNPNWITTLPREAFFLLGAFAMEEARRTMDEPDFDLAGMPARAPPRVSSPSLTSTGARSRRSSSSAPGTTWTPRAWPAMSSSTSGPAASSETSTPCPTASCATPKRSSTITW